MKEDLSFRYSDQKGLLIKFFRTNKLYSGII